MRSFTPRLILLSSLLAVGCGGHSDGTVSVPPDQYDEVYRDGKTAEEIAAMSDRPDTNEPRDPFSN